MGYIDAGYIVVLSALTAYGAILWRRWRRLEARVAPPPRPPEP